MFSLPEEFFLEVFGPYMIELGRSLTVHLWLNIEDVANVSPVIIVVPINSLRLIVLLEQLWEIPWVSCVRTPD